MNDFVKAIGYLILIPIMIIYRGLVFQDFWGWFVEPLGVAAISLAVSSGILLTIGWATSDYTIGILRKDLKAPESDQLTFAIATPAILWCLGWVIQLFI